ncbi:MAG TPA: nickel pincer cofactor biosynthesis protein LarB [Planctomycetota bacterium]|jgi:hypothetical protein|nr:nickel pincer cofactor biosynthesis protein LarB [Planctomycetota bacterium]OQC19467.1 MAG: AIR carboxylase [Planctomycetes bacterium ADurb.Bin069]NMD36047.1 nickel pincer cofactor biosynthesis protein LarB [Planctomycetota bacterium]HNR99708.1 nickel pincer cofactor biosynthesis protein LarB [Planctomycetota bacterium]HNU25327.1 nickel pincer cofactor biosynthesis protein LarB [Planctomycetota bacterium]
MDKMRLKTLLEGVAAGRVTPDEAAAALSSLAFVAAGEWAQVDRHRELRCGFPEVIFCQGKSPEQVAAIARRILEASDRLLATRATPETYEAVRAVAADAVYHDTARTITVNRSGAVSTGLVGVICAGTSDIPVAEEARVTCEILGSAVQTFYDVGVAGLHRLLAHVEQFRKARALVVVAGMEGALASVVAGVAAAPIIAVPTSVGYGANFGGLGALLTMLNSCAAGVAVVNIDNGFGAGYIAALINKSACGEAGR